LHSLNFKVEEFENGEDAYNSTFEINYDMLLLDVRVPGLSGYDIVKKIRSEKNSIPIILITSLTDINNLSIGYEMGCNDYIRKPFELKELKYRIQQILNQVHFKTNKKILDFNNGFSFDLENYELFRKKKKIHLTRIEKRTILSLSKRLNSFVSITTLLDEVWDNKEAVETDVRMCIKRIRDKTDKKFITNQRGLGYSIVTQ